MFTITVNVYEKDVDNKFTLRGKILGILIINIAALIMDFKFFFCIKEVVVNLRKRKEFEELIKLR